VIVVPAMVSVPVRPAAVLGLALAVTVTVPLPEPEAELTVKKDALLVAVHVEGLQPEGLAVMVTVPNPPIPGAGPRVVGDTTKLHEGVWLTLTV